MQRILDFITMASFVTVALVFLRAFLKMAGVISSLGYLDINLTLFVSAISIVSAVVQFFVNRKYRLWAVVVINILSPILLAVFANIA